MQRAWNWQAALVTDPDYVLRRTGQIAATADSQVLDQVQRWFNFAKYAVNLRIRDAWIVNLSR